MAKHELFPIRGDEKRSVTTSSDLSAAKFLFIDYDGAVCGAGKPAVGVLPRDMQYDYSAMDYAQPISVHCGRQALIYSGAAFSDQDQLASDANGKAVVATTGAAVNARALEAATGADELILCELHLAGTDAA